MDDHGRSWYGYICTVYICAKACVYGVWCTLLQNDQVLIGRTDHWLWTEDMTPQGFLHPLA